MWGPEMAKTWPSGPSPAPDIDFRANFTTATLFPNKNGCLEFSPDHLGPRGGPEMAKTWPSGPSPGSDIDFRTNFIKTTLVHNIKQVSGVQSGPP